MLSFSWRKSINIGCFTIQSALAFVQNKLAGTWYKFYILKDHQFITEIRCLFFFGVNAMLFQYSPLKKTSHSDSCISTCSGWRTMQTGSSCVPTSHSGQSPGSAPSSGQSLQSSPSLWLQAGRSWQPGRGGSTCGSPGSPSRKPPGLQTARGEGGGTRTDATLRCRTENPGGPTLSPEEGHSVSQSWKCPLPFCFKREGLYCY